MVPRSVGVDQLSYVRLSNLSSKECQSKLHANPFVRQLRQVADSIESFFRVARHNSNAAQYAAVSFFLDNVKNSIQVVLNVNGLLNSKDINWCES